MIILILVDLACSKLDIGNRKRVLILSLYLSFFLPLSSFLPSALLYHRSLKHLSPTGEHAALFLKYDYLQLELRGFAGTNFSIRLSLGRRPRTVRFLCSERFLSGRRSRGATRRKKQGKATV